MKNSGNWRRVIDANALADGGMAGVEVDGRHIALYNVAGTFFATDNICTHAFAILSDGWLEGDTVECPLHGGRFNVRTGKACGDPVDTDLQTYEARVEGGCVEVFVIVDAAVGR